MIFPGWSQSLLPEAWALLACVFGMGTVLPVGFSGLMKNKRIQERACSGRCAGVKEQLRHEMDCCNFTF